MSRAIAALALALLPALVADRAGADPVDDFLARWEADLQDVRTLHVRFSQTKRLRILRRPRTSTGEVWLEGRRLKMVVTAPDGRVETILSVAGDEARLYYPDLGRLEIYPATAGAAARAPFPMVGGEIRELPRTYRLSLERDGEREILVLVPRVEGAAAESRMTFDGGRLVAVLQVDGRGDVVEIAIEAFEVNAALPPAALEFEVPPGTRVVRPLD